MIESVIAIGFGLWLLFMAYMTFAAIVMEMCMGLYRGFDWFCDLLEPKAKKVSVVKREETVFRPGYHYRPCPGDEL